jgi:hypothetical protein
MAISTEQKQKLRKLLFQVSPADGNEESIEAIEKFQKLMDEYSKLLETSHTSLKSEMKAVQKQHEANLAEMENKMNGHLGKLRASVEDRSKSHKKDLDKTKEEFTQIITEIRDQIRISYSKMGGATMPMLIQVEDAQFAPDGVTTVYYFKNLPTYIVVGGAILVNGDGYSNVVPLVDGYNITFDYPPQGATPNSPAQIPHSFHY